MGVAGIDATPVGDMAYMGGKGGYVYRMSHFSLVVEHPPCKREVAGSIPAGGYPFSP